MATPLTSFRSIEQLITDHHAHLETLTASKTTLGENDDTADLTPITTPHPGDTLTLIGAPAHHPGMVLAVADWHWWTASLPAENPELVKAIHHRAYLQTFGPALITALAAGLFVAFRGWSLSATLFVAFVAAVFMVVVTSFITEQPTPARTPLTREQSLRGRPTEQIAHKILYATARPVRLVDIPQSPGLVEITRIGAFSSSGISAIYLPHHDRATWQDDVRLVGVYDALVTYHHAAGKAGSNGRPVGLDLAVARRELGEVLATVS